MREFDAVINKLEIAYKKYSICEDNELRLGNGLKYVVHDILMEYDKSFLDKLYIELEYREED